MKENNIILFTLLILIGLILGFLLSILVNYLRKTRTSKLVKDMIDRAKKDAEKTKREVIFEQKEESHRLKLELDKEIKEKKLEIKENEERLLQREKNMDKRDEMYQKRETLLDEKEERLNNKLNEIQEERSKVEEIKNEQIELLEKISKFSKEQAKKTLMDEVKVSMKKEVDAYLKEQEQEAKLVADKNAKDLIVTAMQRYASDIANDQTITVVELPNEEMKGRIIGREGRNIRTIEAITGVDLIIDDTPEAVVLSSFDPLRREIARVTLETLIKDGRIQPGRIEEIIEKSKQEVKDITKKAGEEALFKLNLPRMNKDLVELIGRLKFRTSYGQNALTHSMEVAYLAGIMASELGLDQQLAKRAGLLHDLGKALDFEMEGSHVELGVRYAKKYNENEVVINSIESHHGDVPAKFVISNLVSAADTLSAARPGARSETLDTYIKRIEQLETISNSFEGVASAYAIQAGREVRVMVVPEKVDDVLAYKIARDIKNKIETELTYPGQIKVTVVRETRASEIAK